METDTKEDGDSGKKMDLELKFMLMETVTKESGWMVSRALGISIVIVLD